jgi:hypothetical protein
MNRLMEKTVFSGLSTAWRFATWPTRIWPSLPNPTTDGVSRPPSSLMSTFGSLPSITATTEFVVPRSIPMIFAIFAAPSPWFSNETFSRIVVRCALCQEKKQVPCQRPQYRRISSTAHYEREIIEQPPPSAVGAATSVPLWRISNA